MTLDLFKDGAAAAVEQEEPLGPDAVVLRNFAASVEGEILAALESVVSKSPFRYMTTLGGYRMSVKMTNCGSAGWITDKSGYRYDLIDPEKGKGWIPSSCRWYSTAMRTTGILIGLALLMTMAGQGQTAGEISQAREHLNAWRSKNIPLWINDFGDLEKFRAANLALAPPAQGENCVVFFGDSITAGWKLDHSFPGKGYINRGIGGQTTPQMLLRFRQDVIDLQPKVVVVLAGTNDIAGNTGPILLADIEANFASMAELAKLHHIRVVYSSVTPVSDYAPSKDMFAERPRAEILELNRWLKDYCGREGLIYLDYFDALVDGQGMLRRGLSKDGLHPNDTGYGIMAPLASAAVDKALHEETDPSSQAGSLSRP